MMRTTTRGLIRALDRAVTRAVLASYGERPVLLAFAFHAIAPARRMCALDAVVDPTLAASMEFLDRFLTHFRVLGFDFVAPDAIEAGLRPDGKYVMLTFDDGYHNNLEVLPLLRAHAIPATFFISTGHVAEQRAFWWDVIARQRLRRGTDGAAIVREQNELRSMTLDRRYRYLGTEFGPDALRPVGDLDRPLTIAELRAFASDPLVHIGNHTRDHLILTRCGAEAAQEQIEGAQRDLEAWTGVRPRAIAYPNGDHSSAVRDLCRRASLAVGLTVAPSHNRANPSEDQRLRLGRFLIGRAIVEDGSYDQYRSPLTIQRSLDALRHRLRRT
jgi:peptidoglycan/xylan/chitin deacetylase (PgdA/CDA1 family)